MLRRDGVELNFLNLGIGFTDKLGYNIQGSSKVTIKFSDNSEVSLIQFSETSALTTLLLLIIQSLTQYSYY